jgi:hypothetical protein
MFGFHHFFDHCQGRFLDVLAMKGPMRDWRFLQYHFGIVISLTGFQWKSMIYDMRESHGFAFQLGEVVAF